MSVRARRGCNEIVAAVGSEPNDSRIDHIARKRGCNAWETIDIACGKINRTVQGFDTGALIFDFTY